MTTMELDRDGDPTSTTPAEIITVTAGSDGRAWEALVKRYGRMVHSIARSCGLSTSDAADVSQTVWLRLVEHVGRLRHPERIGSWLATTTRNEAMRVARQRRLATPVDGLESFGFVDDSVNHLSAVEAEERQTQVRALVATLPPRQRVLLEHLMADSSPSYEEVASSLGIPVGSIGPTRQRSLRALRSKCIAAHL